MRISKTPLRITLGGGGTDLGTAGTCINMAIDQYVYVAVNPIWEDEYSVKYSEVERTRHVDQIRHDLFRRTFQHCETKPGVEITTMSDVPASSGLGSSGAFTVGLLKALNPDWHRRDLALTACQLDTGMQDQHAATYGGLNLWRFAGHDARNVTQQRTPLDVPAWFFGLALYDTGLRRDAYQTLRTNRRPPDDVLRQQVANMRAGLADPTKFSDCLNEQWASKLDAAPTPIHQYVDHQIKQLKRDGAWGAKLIGAGDGGMILTFSQEVVASPLRRIPIRPDMEGTRII
jgi:D-glycero-alpha-D-manno-heptose-7-phosphate kinase